MIQINYEKSFIDQTYNDAYDKDPAASSGIWTTSTRSAATTSASFERE